MTTLTTPKKLTGSEELVIIPRKDYEFMKSRMMPVEFLHGKSAQKLDRRVATGLRNYRAGKTKKIESLADLD